MKNIQIIDGALNSTFEIYQLPDEIFEIMFPNGTDVAFLDDVQKAFVRSQIPNPWDIVYGNQVNKVEVIGIHGTLHLTASPINRDYFPTGKEAEVKGL